MTETLTKAQEHGLLYFGCIRESGHYLWSSPYRRGSDFEAIPWGTLIDGKLCPPADPWMKGGQPQGLCAVHHKDGWTAVAFWDRSVDKRPGSNSVFLAKGNFTFDQMISMAQENFPEVVKRFTFPLIEPTRAALATKENSNAE